MQRVRFTFNKKPRNKLIEELALYNSRYVKLEVTAQMAHSLSKKGSFSP